MVHICSRNGEKSVLTEELNIVWICLHSRSGYLYTKRITSIKINRFLQQYPHWNPPMLQDISEVRWVNLEAIVQGSQNEPKPRSKEQYEKLEEKMIWPNNRFLARFWGVRFFVRDRVSGELYDFFLLVFTSLGYHPTPPPWMWQADDRLPFNRKPWQRWQDACDHTYIVTLYNTVTPILRRNSFSFVDLEKQAAILCAAILKSQDAEDNLWLKNQQENGNLSPVACKELNYANNTGIEK